MHLYTNSGKRSVMLDGVAELAELEGRTEAQLPEIFRTRPAQEWVDELVAAGAGAHVLADQPDLMHDEVVRARGLSIERDHPGFGRAVLDELGFDSDDLIARAGRPEGAAFVGMFR